VTKYFFLKQVFNDSKIDFQLSLLVVADRCWQLDRCFITDPSYHLTKEDKKNSG